MHNIHLFYNKTIVDLCFGRHGVLVVMGVTLGQFFFKPEKNLEFFRLKNCPRDDYPGKLE